MDYGEGELFYVNLYPITQSMNDSDIQHTFHSFFRQLLESLNLPKQNKDVVLDFNGYVKELHLSNNVTLETKSVLLSQEHIQSVDVKTESGEYKLSNVTNLSISNYSTLQIETNNALIRDGHGFYTEIQTNSSLRIIAADLMNVEILADGDHLFIEQAEQVRIAPVDLSRILARTPKVYASDVTFVEFYPQGTLEWKTRTYGQDLHVIGSTEFSIPLSDTYSALSDIKLGSSFQRNPPIVSFDFSSTASTAILWSLLLLPIFVFLLFIIAKASRNKNLI